MTMDTGHCVARCACLLRSLRWYQIVLLWCQRQCVNDLAKVALDSAVDGIELAISSR